MTEHAQRVLDALKQRPDILFEILREGRDINIAGPWTAQPPVKDEPPIDGFRLDLDEQYLATIYSVDDGWMWSIEIGETPSGKVDTLEDAKHIADQALREAGIDILS